MSDGMRDDRYKRATKAGRYRFPNGWDMERWRERVAFRELEDELRAAHERRDLEELKRGIMR